LETQYESRVSLMHQQPKIKEKFVILKSCSKIWLNLSARRKNGSLAGQCFFFDKTIFRLHLSPYASISCTLVYCKALFKFSNVM